MLNNNYINKIIGNFKIVDKTNKRYSDGSYIYTGLCLICSKNKIDRTIRQLKKRKSCGCLKPRIKKPIDHTGRVIGNFEIIGTDRDWET